jgi:glycosyltransferase involved in cell wall biosynthesis
MGLPKPTILMIAYACDPGGSGEHWLGWGWAEQAAHNYEVDLVTTPKARATVEESSRAAGITPHFVSAPEWLRSAGRWGWAGWWRKLAWQRRVARLAAELHQEKQFALVHQTTFHSFRAPFLAAGLGMPSVWGPIAGGEHVPPGFERYLGRSRFAEASRGFINRLWLQAPSVRRSLRQATVLFVSNHTTLNFLPAACHPRSQIVPPNALRLEDEQCVRPPARPSRPGAAAFQLLYVGNCVATRAMPIVFEALRESRLTGYEFSIVGAGPAVEDWKKRAAELGLRDKVKFVGKVPQAQLAGYYAAADVLVFPALRDSGGSALLEAMARFLPVVCLDWAGPGEMVDSQSGIKIPVLSPEQTVRAFAVALVQLQREPGLRASLAHAARARVEAIFRWQAKRELLEATYRRLVGRT